MGTFETFLRTGHLGPVALGMKPTDVMTALGDPQETSLKSNPLHLKYGCVQLSFWRDPNGRSHRLRDITIAYQPEFQRFPETLEFSDWNPSEPPTQMQFEVFVARINYPPAHFVDGPSGGEMTFLSGVTALSAGGMLHSVRLAQRRNKEMGRTPLSDEREPTTQQILDMLAEADLAVTHGARRAALLIAWAALEAALRRTALDAGQEGKIGVQPSILIRELFGAGKLTLAEHGAIEGLRQMRTALAHGLAPIEFDANSVVEISALTKRLLHKIEAN